MPKAAFLRQFNNLLPRYPGPDGTDLIEGSCRLHAVPLRDEDDQPRVAEILLVVAPAAVLTAINALPGYWRIPPWIVGSADPPAALTAAQQNKVKTLLKALGFPVAKVNGMVLTDVDRLVRRLHRLFGIELGIYQQAIE